MAIKCFKVAEIRFERILWDYEPHGLPLPYSAIKMSKITGDRRSRTAIYWLQIKHSTIKLYPHDFVLVVTPKLLNKTYDSFLVCIRCFLYNRDLKRSEYVYALQSQEWIYSILVLIFIEYALLLNIGVEGLEPTNFRSQTEHFTIKLHPVILFTHYQNRTGIYGF